MMSWRKSSAAPGVPAPRKSRMCPRRCSQPPFFSFIDQKTRHAICRSLLPASRSSRFFQNSSGDPFTRPAATYALVTDDIWFIHTGQQISWLGETLNLTDQLPGVPPPPENAVCQFRQCGYIAGGGIRYVYLFFGPTTSLNSDSTQFGLLNNPAPGSFDIWQK